MSEGKIYKAMTAIMADAKAIGKDSQNRQQGFSFRGIDAVMDHLHPVFSKHGVFIMPEVVDERTEERQTKSGGNLIYRMLRIKFTFIADDGSCVACVVQGEGMDSGDKAANKAMAVALKYALSQSLLLPYNEVDPDAETPDPSKPKKETSANNAPEAPSKAGKLDAKTISFLKAMSECKQALGEPMYRQLLQKAGYSSSKDVTESGARKAVYSQMTQQIEENAKAVFNG